MRKLSNGELSPFQSFRCYLDTRLLDRINIIFSDSNHQPTLSYLLNELLDTYVSEKEAENE
jgi:hypothetical protein